MGVTKDRALEAVEACAELAGFRKGVICSFINSLSDEKLRSLKCNDADTDDKIAGFLSEERDRAYLANNDSKDAVARFTGFLKDGGVPRPDKETMIRLQTHFPVHVMACASKEAALQVYATAKHMPSTDTCDELANRSNIRLDGAVSAHNHASSTLVYAWKDGEPKLLKIPHNLDDAAGEVAVWGILSAASSTGSSSEFILGPMELVHLRGRRRGVLMPLLPSTLQQAPRPMAERDVLRICRQLLASLEHFHAHKLGHNDVKPSNVLLATDGTCKLCDFGSAKRVDEATGTTTRVFVPTGIASVTGLEYDCAMLGMTVLYLLGRCNAESAVSVREAQLAAARVADVELRELLVRMLGGS